MWGLLCSFLYSLAFGAFLHVLYDGVRILRALCGVHYGGRLGNRLCHCRLPGLGLHFASRPPLRVGEHLRAGLIFVTDLLFVVVGGVLFSVFVYWQNDGVFRAIFLVGMGAGFFLWHVTLGRVIVASAETVAFFLRVIVAYLFLCIRVPASFFARILARVGGILFVLLRRFFRLLYGRLWLPGYSRREEKRRLRTAYADLLPKS